MALAGCGDSTSSPSHLEPPTLRIVSTGSLTDTIGAPVRPIVAEVRGPGGAPAVGAAVTFRVRVAPPVPTRPGEYPILIADSTSPFHHPQSAIRVLADSSGRASVQVHSGTLPGETTVVAMIDSTTLADSVRYTVLPGNAAALEVSHGDTALYVGAGYQLSFRVADRWNNPRPDDVGQVRVEPGPPAATIDAAGRVRAEAIGRSFVVARLGGLVDTAFVSVVPEGTLAVAVGSRALQYGVAVVNLDGSGFRMLAPQTEYHSDQSPGWSPDGSRIVFHQGYHERTRLRTVDMSGDVRDVATAPLPYVLERGGRFSPDGRWIYYSAGMQYPEFDLWRIRSDGTGGPERLTTTTETRQGTDWQLSPSPDGARLVYFNTWFGLRLLDPETRAVTPLGVTGQTPVFSPSGEWIAFVDYFVHELRIVRRDGTGLREVRVPQDWYGYSDLGLDWSPDERWLIARVTDGLQLIELETGLLLPLPYSGNFFQPDWRSP